MKKFYSIGILIFVIAISLNGQSRIYPPDLRAPENKAGEQNPDIILDWDAVTGQTTDITYEVQLATMADFSDAVTFDRTDLTSLAMSQLIFGQLYYWHVKAYDAEEPSDWSEVWSFTVTGSVNITSPTIDKEDYAIALVKWDAISGLNNYQLQIDTTYEWKSQTGVTEDDIFGTAVVASDDMWFVGEGGMVQHYDGSAWSIMDAGVTEDLNGVAMLDATNGFVVGAGGTALSYNGTDWTAMNTGIDLDLNDVSFIDANNGWAVGADGTVLKFEDGTWTSETSPTSEILTGVFAVSPANVWACGEGSIVLHYNGNEWASEEIGNKDFNDIWFADANNGWVVGKSGNVFHYNGIEWIEQESGISKEIFSVCFDGMKGYAVADDGIMLNYIGGWRVVSSEASNELNAVSINADAGLVGGNAGTVVLKSEDGFNSPYLRTLNVPYDSASFEVTNLLYGAKSYYRMRALHDSDTTEWSGGRSLITYPSPELDKPNNGSDGTDLVLTFEWDEYDGSSDYFFQIADNEEFNNPFNSNSDSTSTDYQMKRFGQEFFWRVKAVHALDESAYSEAWTITTANEVSLSNPDNEEVDVPFCPSYEWEEIAGVANYEIWIDTDADFSNPIMGVSETPSFQCNEPLERKTMYYWKVRATTTVDTSDWSGTWSFTVEGYAGIGDNDFTSELVDLYPNPSDGEFNLVINSYANALYNISIVDITGKVIYEESINCKAGENIKVLQLTEARKGLYMLNIRRQDKVVSKKLFVK